MVEDLDPNSIFSKSVGGSVWTEPSHDDRSEWCPIHEGPFQDSFIL